MIEGLDRGRRQIRRMAGLHEAIAAAHAKLARGQVWCRSCGATRAVDAAACLRSGWPKCCGATMTIDAPEERRG
jgi:hypothetical protein